MDLVTKWPLRELERIAEMAHAVPCAACPGCGMEILAMGPVQDPTKQMLVAQPDDETPAKTVAAFKAFFKRFAGKTWGEIHAGVVYGHYPLLNIPTSLWPICMLHMNLRIINMLFVKLVVNQIGNAATGKANDQTKALMKLLIDPPNSVYIKESKLKAKKKTVKAAWDKVSFAGRDAGAVDRARHDVLEITYPKAQRDKHPKVKLQWERAVACWDKWHEVWLLLNEPLEDLDDAQAARDKRADEFQVAAVGFVKLWISAHERGKGLYLHILVAHVPAMIRRFGDLRPYQVQGLEHSHSIGPYIAYASSLQGC